MRGLDALAARQVGNRPRAVPILAASIRRASTTVKDIFYLQSFVAGTTDVQMTLLLQMVSLCREARTCVRYLFSAVARAFDMMLHLHIISRSSLGFSVGSRICCKISMGS